jgi:hypothetical protein
MEMAVTSAPSLLSMSSFSSTTTFDDTIDVTIASKGNGVIMGGAGNDQLRSSGTGSSSRICGDDCTMLFNSDAQLTKLLSIAMNIQSTSSFNDHIMASGDITYIMGNDHIESSSLQHDWICGDDGGIITMAMINLTHQH